ncbi:MAG: iron-containing alcohol dehydrogenase [Clostridiales Family XIII bacterium]|jgi:alcohol dehydrogenase class IV|nr:iron-containing alcohol dehydrogenase [Clostridiales Family XIII bacterium]
MPKIEMMDFGIRQHLYQGTGASGKLPEILEQEGWKRVMLITDPVLYKTGVAKPIEDSIKKAGAEYIVFTNVRPNPEVLTIEQEAIPAYREFGGADVVVAVGGGSTIDTAKGVVIVGLSDHKVMDFTIDKITRDQKFGHKMPALIAIPTTAGTGADVCVNAVISDENDIKLVVAHDSILPGYSLMDPDLLAGLPFSVAAATSMDAFTHALESLTNRNANDFTKTHSLRALELIGECIRGFVSNPSDKANANKMSLACMYAGFSLGQSGIGQIHVLTHPIGEAPFHLPHGDACAMVTPAVIEYNGLAAKELYLQAYNALTKENVSAEEFDVQYFIDWVVELNSDLHIAKDMSFEEWGYNDGEPLQKILDHPITQLALQINTPAGICEYPRFTTLKDFETIVKRTNLYSKQQAAIAKAKQAQA